MLKINEEIKKLIEKIYLKKKNLEQKKQFKIISELFNLEDDKNYIKNIIKIISDNFCLNHKSFFLEIKGTAGGDDAKDFALMLKKMYEKFFINNNISFELLDDDCFKVNLPIDFFYYENGIHKLIRFSPFKKNNQRHTGFSSVFLYPLIINNNIVLKEKDLEITSLKASGPGGQHVNKTESAIRIKHIPSGLIVVSRFSKSQNENKKLAMDLLLSKLKRNELEKQQETVNQYDRGDHFRTYTLDPKQMLKDTKLNIELYNVLDVFDGNVWIFFETNLKNLLVKYLDS